MLRENKPYNINSKLSAHQIVSSAVEMRQFRLKELEEILSELLKKKNLKSNAV